MEEKITDRHDPGWNDPPLFTYDKAASIQASANKKGISLNKRVVYPMGGSNVNLGAQTLLNNSPQMMTPPKALVLPTCDSTSSNQNATVSLSKTEKLEKVLKNLESAISNVDDEEISKRIKMLEKMWVDDKLDENVQSRLVDLTQALSEGNIELADHMQKGLMVDYVSQCSTWMSGVRQLINLKRESNMSNS